jgi:hypothetical protein
MGRIKSALELALERTSGIASDMSSIARHDARQKGKKLANEFLAQGVPAADGDDSDIAARVPVDIKETLKKVPKDSLEAFKQGFFDILLVNIALPSREEDLDKIERTGEALHELTGNPQVNALFKQFLQTASRYIAELGQYDDAIHRQYAPKLRQKEEMLSRQYGRHVQIDPYQDPEFVAFYNQNINALKTNYTQPVDEFRAKLKTACGIAPPL